MGYPGQWGRSSWLGLPGHTFTARHDGTSCQRPGDGGLVRTPNGNIYRIVGGAPLHLSRCDYTNGCAGFVQLPNLDGYAPYPRDGALVANVDDGGIYRFAGGAPLWISSCEYAPGCGGVVQVDAHPFAVDDHMRAYPADGTLIANHGDGGIYRFAGGAPLWISSCEYAPGCGGVVTLDGGTFARNGAISGAPRMREHPADGTMITNHADGGIYRFAGGAPLWISSCEYAPGCGGVVTLDGGTFARNGAISGAPRMREYPADGTYLRIAGAGRPMRVAGGAPLALTDCSVLDGACEPSVTIDAGTLDRRGAISGADRLAVVPAEGTVLTGRPSGASWRIIGSSRLPAAAGESGVQVNDATLDGFAPPPGSAAPAAPGAGIGAADDSGVAAADLLAPKVSLRARRQRLRRALHRGVAIAVQLDEPASVTLRLRFDAASANPVTVARKRFAGTRGTREVRLRLHRRGAAVLRRLPDVTLWVVASVVDPAGNRAGSRIRVHLRR